MEKFYEEFIKKSKEKITKQKQEQNGGLYWIQKKFFSKTNIDQTVLDFDFYRLKL